MDEDLLLELYQEIILDHSKNPRNFGNLEDCSHKLLGFNPYCGDKIEIQVNIVENIIKKIKFKGCGCAISTASASMLCEQLLNTTTEKAKIIFEEFHKLLTENKDSILLSEDCKILKSVKNYPSRIKCATLAWHTLNAILNGETNQISTEDREEI